MSFQAAELVQIYTDWSVLVAHGGVELGQGINTKMIQVREGFHNCLKESLWNTLDSIPDHIWAS